MTRVESIKAASGSSISEYIDALEEAVDQLERRNDVLEKRARLTNSAVNEFYLAADEIRLGARDG